MPNISNVLSIENVSDNTVTLTASQDEKIVKMKIKMPCVISVDADINTPRLPSFKVQKQVDDSKIQFLSFADFEDQNVNNYGLAGSATQVERIFPPEKLQEKCSIQGTPTEQADQLYDLIRRIKIV